MSINLLDNNDDAEQVKVNGYVYEKGGQCAWNFTKTLHVVTWQNFFLGGA